ncbi:hypothetical protein [Amycolatopsis sp. NPDC051372]
MSWYKALALVASGAAALGMAQPPAIGADGVGDPYFPGTATAATTSRATR